MVADFPILLRKDPVVVRAILVVIHPPAAKTELWRPQQKILKVRCRGGQRPIRRSVRKKQFAIEYLRKELVEIHARELAAEAEQVCALYPTYGVYKVVVVLRLVLIPKRRRSDFKPDRKSTRLNSSHANISYAVFCLKKKKKIRIFV